MNKLLNYTAAILGSLVLFGCGNSNTSATGDDDDVVGQLHCADFTVAPGLACTDTGAGGIARLVPAIGTANDTATAGNDGRLSPAAAQGTFAGTTTPGAPSLGQRVQSGNTLGVRAANIYCGTAFSGSHACTNEEIYKNAHAGLIPVGTGGAIFESGPYTANGVVAAASSSDATCAHWTDATGTTGSRFDVQSVTAGGVTGLAVKLTPNQPCATQLQIACCY